MNNNVLCSIVSFLSGAAISGFVVWKIVDKKCDEKYSKLAQEEIDSVKAKFTVAKVTAEPKKDEKKEDKESVAKKDTNKPSLVEYTKRIKEYINYSNVESKEEEKDIPAFVKASVISPDEFGEDEDYDKVELTFYADGILANDDDEILEADEILGKGSLDSIGEYEDDVLHVKNETLKTYYEVLVDNRSYKDVTGKDPHPDEDGEDK